MEGISTPCIARGVNSESSRFHIAERDSILPLFPTYHITGIPENFTDIASPGLGLSKDRIVFKTDMVRNKWKKLIAMGLFDKLKGSKAVELNPKSALVLSAITVIASDGVIEESEMMDLSKIVHGDRNAVKAAVQVLQNITLPEAMDLVAKTLNEQQKMSAMAILMDLAMSDGILAGNEQKILQQYMEKFGITEAALKPIIDTIALKNDFSVFS